MERCLESMADNFPFEVFQVPGATEHQLPGESNSLVWTSVERFYSRPVLIAELNQLTRKFHAEVEFGSLAIDVGLRWVSPSRIAVCREKVNDDHHTGRPRSLRCDENKLKIKELIKSNRRISIKDLSSETGLSVGLCHQIVTKDLDMIRTSSKFVPRILTEEQKEFRLDVCKNMVEMTRTDPEWMQKIITGDETWVYQYDPETKRQSSQWIERGEPNPKRQDLQNPKSRHCLLHFFILMVWFTMNLFLSDVQLIKRFIWG
ncbi:hypothetical protein LAZ67_10000284 [Cordylochernes scorpioides]|uniref:Transposase n=1 Tax=Cordylochernes scorpioides TaxID=51811 RepID=A0ABY6KYQ1_9ARAC|nr:hypothetical protein LAZ67_10000284 [Cordylochernes scorpioides]